jgi:hypothetical protein
MAYSTAGLERRYRARSLTIAVRSTPRGYARSMSDEPRADADKVREVAEQLGSPGQDATPDERDDDERDALQAELRRRQARGDDQPVGEPDT